MINIQGAGEIAGLRAGDSDTGLELRNRRVCKPAFCAQLCLQAGSRAEIRGQRVEVVGIGTQHRIQGAGRYTEIHIEPVAPPGKTPLPVQPERKVGKRAVKRVKVQQEAVPKRLESEATLNVNRQQEAAVLIRIPASERTQSYSPLAASAGSQT